MTKPSKNNQGIPTKKDHLGHRIDTPAISFKINLTLAFENNKS